MQRTREDGYGTIPNNDASERNFAIFRDALQHMGNASIYRAAAEAQSRMNNDCGRNINALVLGRSSKVVSSAYYVRIEFIIVTANLLCSIFGCYTRLIMMIMI